jgi:hypothetical protein
MVVALAVCRDRSAHTIDVLFVVLASSFVDQGNGSQVVRAEVGLGSPAVVLVMCCNRALRSSEPALHRILQPGRHLRAASWECSHRINFCGGHTGECSMGPYS